MTTVEKTSINHDGKLQGGLNPEQATFHQCTVALRILLNDNQYGSYFRPPRTYKDIDVVQGKNTPSEVLVRIHAHETPYLEEEMHGASYQDIRTQLAVFAGSLLGNVPVTSGGCSGYGSGSAQTTLEFAFDSLPTLARAINGLAQTHGQKTLDRITALSDPDRNR